MSRRSLALAILSLWQAPAWAQTGTPAPATPPPICDSAPYHQFDFFAGTFTVSDQNDVIVADETVAPQFDHCILHESFVGRNGRAAESMSFYDPVERKWFQYATGLGLIFRLQGELRNGAMELEGTITHLRRGEVRPMRARFAPLPDGNVREELYEQAAGAQAYALIFAGTLHRQAASGQAGGNPH